MPAGQTPANFFADTDGIAQINSKELEDGQEQNTLLDAFYTKGYAASKIFAQTLGATKGKKSLPEAVTEYAWLPSYSAFRPLDVAYQCAQSAKKKYLLGVLYEWVYVEGRKVIVFTMWP
ncbi:hypothetical protein D6C87_07794 [Aureobasidium pullulans]|uniref:Uncharacterized protein n=1 Tax=Aureobasidium pullulans TaxID=5580 RepID=A0AB38LJH2_AURPU|nr:hypothetical protein D6C94_09724 [Aureobasidium pullulans]THZ38479.1 hypothetical protein D6C87_07794 [Aureobasidium pullulans]